MVHPAEAEVKAKASLSDRLARRITAFAGNMKFVWLHAALFALWMTFGEKNPWPMLTLIVSLEAIFLSTFVMIGQNQAADIASAKATHDYEIEHALTQAIHDLTVEIHGKVVQDGS